MSLIKVRKSATLNGEDKRDGKDRRDSAGILTTGTKVKFDNGVIGEIIKVKRIYSHGFVEPEYTIRLPNGRSYIANEGQFTAQDAVARNAASDELNVGDKIWITQYGRNYPYTITKKWKEGWTVWYKAKNDKSGKEEIVSGAFANALDAAAQDAKFKIGDKVKYTGSSALIYGKTGSVGTIKSVDTTIFEDGYPLYEVEFPETRHGMTELIGEEHLRRV